MKKHLIISSYDDIKNPYFGGGGAKAIYEIARRLSKYYSITILSSSYPGSKNETVDEVRFQHIGIPFAGPKIGQLLFNLFVLLYARTYKYDLWIESFTPPFSVSLLPIFVNKPLIGLIHMLSGLDMARKYHLPFNLVERIGLKMYSRFITTTPNVSNFVRNICPTAKIALIPNGVTPYKLIHKVSSNPVLIFLGRIEVNQKGLDLLIESFSQLKRSDISLIIAGSGIASEMKLLNNLISKTKYYNRIQLIGRVDEVQKRNLFSKATCLILPSRFETFSLVALEALANQIPLVSFDIPGLAWIPKSDRSIANQLNSNSLTVAIKRVIDHPKFGSKISQSGYLFSTSFNWDKLELDYRKFIDSFI
jgi:phosphatidyl-myo-inositol alpha-mannosyltransferase